MWADGWPGIGVEGGSGVRMNSWEEMEGNKEVIDFPHVWICQEIPYKLAHVGFHLQASSSYPGPTELGERRPTV